MNILKVTILLILLPITGHLFAKDLVDDDPRRTVVYQQPRLEVISAILQKHYDKGSAEDLYKIYKTNPSAFDEMKVEFTDTTNTYKFRNPNGVDSPPTEVRVWKRYNRDGSDWSFDSLFGLTKTFVGREISELTEIVNKLPAYNPSLQTSVQEKAPTSIQLKAMQTRKFNKSPWEIKKAMEEYFKDKDGMCFLNNLAFSPSQMNSVNVNGKVKTTVNKYIFIEGSGKGTCIIRDVSYDIEISATPPKPLGNESLLYDPGLLSGSPSIYKVDNCVVRVRIKNGIKQKTDPKSYQVLFKEIADQAFIEALEIDPALIE